MNSKQRQQLILDMITAAGPVTAHAISEALNMKLETVAAACGNLKKTGHLHSIEDDSTPRRRTRRMIWSVTPPAVVRYRKVPETVGIDEDDLAWMTHYRQQAQQRQQRRAVT